MTSHHNIHTRSDPPITASSLLTIFILLSGFPKSLSLTSDGSLLLAFKYSILSDPLSILENWHYTDQTPCLWTGVTCNSSDYRVTAISLPNSKLFGSIPPDIGLIDHLQHLDLSNNLLNGSLPATLFNSSQLQNVSLANNVIFGELPPLSPNATLTHLNLSDNALAGPLPHSLGDLRNLTVISLKGNYFSGALPAGFSLVETLDLSFNLLNGSLPSDLGGSRLRFLNLSNNRLSGEIPPDFFSPDVPQNATIDLAFNNFTGQIPSASKALISQKPEAFAGNPDLCGKPLKNMCVIPSSLSNPPNAAKPTSISPAIAVIPKSFNGSTGNPTDITPTVPGDDGSSNNGLKPMTIVGITVADITGIILLGLGLFYLYRWRKRKAERNQKKPGVDKSTAAASTNRQPFTGKSVNNGVSSIGGKEIGLRDIHTHTQTHIHQLSLQFESTPSPASAGKICCCLHSRGGDGSSSEVASTSEARTSSESEDCAAGGRLVMVDGETEMDMETLLKASAYVLGASGASIVYKAVLQSGVVLAVRRIGDGAGGGGGVVGGGGLGGERIKKETFEGQVRAMGKLRHPNVVRVRGFYWGCDEKLIISDYVDNGSLASISGYKKAGSSSPCHLTLEVRLKIARGVARGLTYIHEKKFVHGNLKPSNILLTQEMEPLISDLGINWIIYGNRPGGWSGRQFGSKRLTTTDWPSTSAYQDASAGSSSPYSSHSAGNSTTTSPYQAPETMKSLKPSPKWDVYSFGIVLLELLTGGKLLLDRELGQWTPGNGVVEDRYWALRMADATIRADVHGKEEVVTSVFRLGFQCAGLMPQKRPSMKEALQVLEKTTTSCSSSSQ